MGKSRLTIKGTGQLGGPVMINQVIEMDTHMANKFMGYDRDVVMEEFLKVHYPGVKVNPKNIHVNIEHLKEESEKKVTKTSSSNSSIKPQKSASNSKSVIGGIVGGLIADPLKKFVKEEFFNDEQALKKKPKNKIMNVNNTQQENISKLLDEKLSIDKEELSVQLENMYISIVDLNTIECDKNTNRLFETIIQKFEFGLRNLEKSGESAENINYYKKKLRNAKIKRFLKNFFNF